MTVTVFGIAVAAVFDTVASLSLTVDYRIELCIDQKANLGLQISTGPETIASQAVRSQTVCNEKKCSQRFVRLPGLTVPTLSERDFNFGENLTLDIPNKGYRFGSDEKLVPFVYLTKGLCRERW